MNWVSFEYVKLCNVIEFVLVQIFHKNVFSKVSLKSKCSLLEKLIFYQFPLLLSINIVFFVNQLYIIKMFNLILVLPLVYFELQFYLQDFLGKLECTLAEIVIANRLVKRLQWVLWCPSSVHYCFTSNIYRLN